MPHHFHAQFPESRNLSFATDIVRRLQEDGHSAYFVGGCVRDAVLGARVVDYDIATGAPPARIEELFRHTVPVGESFGVMLVVCQGIPFEVATFRSESGYADRRRPSNIEFSTAEQDVKRRDFTINGLFFDPIRHIGIDYVNGIEDIDARVLRTIGKPEERFDEDALRLMRAIRMAATYDLKIEEDTYRALLERVDHLHEISAERISEEWTKALLQARAPMFLRMMVESGIAAITLPPVARIAGLKAAGVDVLEATGKRLEQVGAEAAIPDELRAEAMWAALFFELGRPEATRRTEQGIWLGEAMMFAAADMWVDCASALAMSKYRRRVVEERLESAPEWQNFDQLARWRQRMLLAAEAAPLDMALLRSFAAVYQTSPRPLQAAEKMLADYAARGEPLMPPPLLNGNDLIREAGLRPGPRVGEILDEVRRRQLDGQISSRDAAIAVGRELAEPASQGSSG